YEAVLELRKEMQSELERLTKQKELRYSQFLLIEKNLKELSKNHKITREKLAEIKKEVEEKISFAANWNPRPPITYVKCKGCKRQMRVDVPMLYHLEKEEKIFGDGSWRACDNYGNTIPGATPYPDLAAFHAAYGTGGNSWVYQCVYCYKDDE